MTVQKKLEVLALVEKLGNVSEASRQSGVSRDTIYRHLKLVKQGGVDALKQQETPNIRHKNGVDMVSKKLLPSSHFPPSSWSTESRHEVNNRTRYRYQPKWGAQCMVKKQYEYHCMES